MCKRYDENVQDNEIAYLGISLGKIEHQDRCWWISEMTRLNTSFANAKKNC